uniref:Uncharacterized protein n=1 Tax=Siphoviridae sp. ctbBv3 TaxID=2826392 RepID=A0A8S5NHQ0_9CAUD|nr:MAG TPA: hypothetical protein [Siphoviridae sp. ctbBv3]
MKFSKALKVPQLLHLGTLAHNLSLRVPIIISGLLRLSLTSF